MSVRSSHHADNARPIRARARLLGGLLAALSCAPASTPPAATAAEGPTSVGPAGATAQVLPGIDVWLQRGLAPLAGARVGLITNTTGRTADGRLTLDVLIDHPGLTVAAVLAPEHSFAAALKGPVPDGIHQASGLPLFSLYGDTRRPTAAMLDGLDALVFDIQDIGTRFYTYATTMGYAMEEAAAHGLRFVVLDRPNPIGGRPVSGAVRAPGLEHFIAYSRIPVRHGMTLGELALLFRTERELDLDLTVIEMEGWRRELWYDQTGLVWVDPSPNIRSLTQATLYPAVGVLEWTDLSVGRGTAAPFEWLGAPWIDGVAWAADLRALGLPGIGFVPRRQTPRAGPFAGEECDGVMLVLRDREVFDAGLTAAALAATLAARYGSAWERSRLPTHWGEEAILEQLAAGWDPARIVASWQDELEQFHRRRAAHLLYD